MKVRHFGISISDSKIQQKLLSYLDDLCRLFFNKYNNLFVVHTTPVLEIRKIIHSYIFTFFFGETLAFKK